jgi:hypothetical protein
MTSIKKIQLNYSPSFEVIKSLQTQRQTQYSSSIDGRTIRWVSESCHVDIIKLLLADQSIDPSVDNNYAIRWASRFGYIEVVKLLLADYRVDPSVENNYAIRRAWRFGHTEVVNLLLDDSRVLMFFK